MHSPPIINMSGNQASLLLLPSSSGSAHQAPLPMLLKALLRMRQKAGVCTNKTDQNARTQVILEVKDKEINDSGEKIAVPKGNLHRDRYFYV